MSTSRHHIDFTRRGSSQPKEQQLISAYSCSPHFISLHLTTPFSLLSCFVFAVSILIGQLPVASAGCANFTFIYYTVNVPFGFYTRFKQKLDFVSSKSLLPNSPQSFNDSNASSLDREEDTSYIFNQSNDVSDSESIFKLIADYFAGGI
jgi:hypothetical protein